RERECRAPRGETTALTSHVDGFLLPQRGRTTDGPQTFEGPPPEMIMPGPGVNPLSRHIVHPVCAGDPISSTKNAYCSPATDLALTTRQPYHPQVSACACR